MNSAILIAWLAFSPTSPTNVEFEPWQRYERSEIHMGASFGIVLYAPDPETANGAFQAAFARVEELNRICSDYDSSSEVSRLCAQSPTSSPVKVSDDLYFVLSESQKLSVRSDGALDVTIGPLTKLWRRARQLKVPPDPERIRRELQAVGYKSMELDDSNHTVQLRRPGMRIDLGAIAKGYAADEALRTIRMHGIDRALVNASGNLSVGAPPPNATAWRVEIAGLDTAGLDTPGLASSDKKSVRTVWLANAGIATAGDKFQFLEYEGKRYSHILDPRTGYGITGMTSVTIIAPNGMVADGLDTTVAILGPERGLKLVEDTPGAAAYIVMRDGAESKDVRVTTVCEVHRTPVIRSKPNPSPSRTR